MQARAPLWHYTVDDRLNKILKSGHIRPATAGVPERERPLVWFSANQIFERTSAKVFRKGYGLVPWPESASLVPHVRLGIGKDVPLRHWSEIKKALPPKRAKFLEQTGRMMGAKPWEWWGSYEPVLLSQLTTIEVYQDGKWKHEGEHHERY